MAAFNAVGQGGRSTRLDEFAKSEATVSSRSFLAIAGFSGLTVVGTGLFMALLPRDGALGLVCTTGWLAFLLVCMKMSDRVRRTRRGELRANESGVWLNGRRIMSRQSIRAAFMAVVDDRPVLRFRRRLVRCDDLELSDEAEGQAVLSSLRLDPESRVARFRVRQGPARAVRSRAALVSILGFVLALLFVATRHWHDLWSLTVAPMEFGVWLGTCVLAYSEVSVTMGTDGMLMRHAWIWKRLILFSDIVDVRETDGTAAVEREVHLDTRNGRRVCLYAAGRLPLFSPARSMHPDVSEIARQIRARLPDTRRAAKTEDAFARAGRSVNEWMREAEAVLDGAASYRDPAIPADEAWRVVEDPRAEASARVGAALALRPGLDESGRARLRVAAEATAAPHLRVALEAMASDKDLEAVRRAADRASKLDLGGDDVDYDALAVATGCGHFDE